MTPKEIDRIAAAMCRAKGTGDFLSDERNMWLICINRIADELWNAPNFNRTNFLIACGVYPALQCGGLSDDKKPPPLDVRSSARIPGSRPPSSRQTESFASQTALVKETSLGASSGGSRPSPGETTQTLMLPD